MFLGSMGKAYRKGERREGYWARIDDGEKISMQTHFERDLLHTTLYSSIVVTSALARPRTPQL